MENKHFIGQSKTDGILGVMEADNVRPVVFNLVQEGIRLQFSLRPTKILGNKYFIRKKKGTIVSVRKSQEDMRF